MSDTTCVLDLPYGTGPTPNAKKRLGNMLTREHGAAGRNFLTKEIADVAQARLREGGGAVEPFRRAQDAQAPADNADAPVLPDDGATPEPDKKAQPTDTATLDLSGAENLTAATKAVALMEQAAALRKEKKDAEADALKASIEQAQIAAFHPPEFEKTFRRAEELASRARFVEAKDAAKEAELARDHAQNSVKAAQAAVTLVDARAGSSREHSRNQPTHEMTRRLRRLTRLGRRPPRPTCKHKSTLTTSWRLMSG